MKPKKGIFLIVFSLIFFYGQAQIQDDFILKSLKENDITKMLPPLDTMLMLAENNSPLLDYHNSNVVINKLKVISQKRDWMEYLAFESSVRYGLFDNLILKEALGVEDLAASTTEQTRYALGISVRVPVSRIYDRKNRIEIAKNEMEQAIYERESTLMELRQLVMVQYNNVVKSHRLMVVGNANTTSFNVQMIRAEKDFVNGQISIAEMARLRQMHASAVENFETNKSDFQLALLLLEETIGNKLKLE